MSTTACFRAGPETATRAFAARSRPPVAPRAIVGPMNPAGAEKVDPMDLAFDNAPEREATEAEIKALREARALSWGSDLQGWVRRDRQCCERARVLRSTARCRSAG